MSDKEREERSLSALNIHQLKVEQALQRGNAIEIDITVFTRDQVLEWHEETFSCVFLDHTTGKWGRLA